MKHLLNLLVLICVIKLALTAPIDDPNDDVELVPSSVVRTSSGGADRDEDNQERVPVFIIKTSKANNGLPFLGSSGFLPFFEAILGGGQEEEEEVIPSFPPIRGFDLNINDEELPEVVEDVFGSGNRRKCGLFCKIFQTLGTQLKEIEDQLKDSENQVPSSDDDRRGQPQTVYEEKVLDDGTVIQIKKTSYSDASDDGTSYFGYHSTKVVVNDDEEIEPEEATTTLDYPEEVLDDEQVDKVKPIKLSRQDNLRKKRQVDPFNQQTEDLSFLNQISQSPIFNQAPAAAAAVVPPFRSVYYPSFEAARSIEPVTVKPISFEGDTRVNDLLLEDARRGGLVQIEPDSEFIDGEAGLLGLVN